MIFILNKRVYFMASSSITSLKVEKIAYFLDVAPKFMQRLGNS